MVSLKQSLTPDEQYQEMEAGKSRARLILYLIGSLITSIVLLFVAIGMVHAEEYTNDQYVNAIGKAECGQKMDKCKEGYYYGIRSIKCHGKAECRKICERTIANSRIRYAEYGHFRFDNFIEFLGSKYAPSHAGNDPHNLNQNWIKLVKYFLKTDKK